MKIFVNGHPQNFTGNIVEHADIVRLAGANEDAIVAVRLPDHPARVLPVGSGVSALEGAEFTVAPAPVKGITVNGAPAETAALTLSYEQVLELAGETPGATVVFHAVNEDGWEKNGMLVRGQSVKVYQGMSFDAVHTGSA